MENALLEIKDLKKAYGEHIVLDGLDLAVNKGEVVVVIGPSGCGKSTLLRCVNALEDIQGGQVLLDGEPVRRDGKNISQMRQKIGMVFQSYDLFPHKTILENILLAPLKVQKRQRAEAEREALELLDRVGLADRRDDYPRQLSGGQKQRVAIVRALIMHPEILLLDEITAALDPEMVHEVLQVVLALAMHPKAILFDEPTSALDPEMIGEVLDVMTELAREGMTMVIVTHEMTFARAIADRVIFLEDGHIVEESREPKAFFDAPATERARQFLRTFEY